jgi:uncharacterized cupredoxin-like copper-binding protein
MKRFYLCFTLLFLASALLSPAMIFGQTNLSAGDGSTVLQLLQTDDSGIRLINRIETIAIEEIVSADREFTKLSIPGYVNNLQFGAPELPVFRRLVEIPEGAEVKVSVVGFEHIEYDLAEYGYTQPLYPSQPPRIKSEEEHSLVFNSKDYHQNNFNQNELVTVDVLGSMRGTRIARINISPVRYNPAFNRIKVFGQLEFTIGFSYPNGTKNEVDQKHLRSPYFSGITRGLLNRKITDQRENLTSYPVSYVIISDRMFEEQMQAFIEWKTQKGFKVIEAYTDQPEVGNTTTSIKAYLQGLYNAGTPEDPAPSFVLFVGDVQQIPAWNNGNGATDRNYVEYTGDLFPEIFYGRFSAQTTAQLQPMIDKTLQYEQYTMPDPDYLNEVVIVAGMDGSHGYNWGNGQVNYGTINYFNADHGILAHTYLYPESGSQSAQIRQNVSDGVTFSNYTAHCSPDGWGDPSFSISHIPALQNQDKYGFMLSNCCSSAEYQLSECFAEAIVRAAGKGAVGHAGGSNSTYWDEDYYFAVGVGAITETPPAYEETSLGAFDRMFHTHGEAFPEWYTTQDQVIFAGNLAVTEGSPGMAQYYWDIYNLIGDPSLMVYFSEPPVMTVTHTPFLPVGSTSITVEAVPYAYVGFTLNGVLYGAGLADETGLAVVELDALSTPGMGSLTVTAQNYQPYVGQVIVNAPDGPYVIYHTHVIQDEDGNGQADFGEHIALDMTMENVGNGLAEDVTVTLNTESEFVTVTENMAGFGDIEGNQTAFVAGAFSLNLHNNVPDKQNISFNLIAESEGREIWNSSFSIQAHAPVLHVNEVAVNDAGGNGRLEPGETGSLVLMLKNTGSADLKNSLSQLSCSNPGVSVNTEPIAMELIQSGQTIELTYQVSVSPDTEDGSTVIFSLETIGNNEFSSSSDFSLTIGQIPVLLLDLAGSPSASAMQSCFNTLNVGAEMINGMPADLSLYKSIFVCLGIYPQNHVLSSSAGQQLADYLDQGGKLYMEGGDTWAYDNATPVHSYFHIDGLEDGSGDLGTIIGMEGSLGQDLQFEYDGTNSYIDRIEPGEGAVAMFSNAAPDYDVAVSYENAVYKTIGTSFEFSGLKDNGSNTKDYLMSRILSWFEVPYFWTSVNTIATESMEISLYPNPAGEATFLRVRNLKNMQVQVSVYNLLGQKLLSLNEKDALEDAGHMMFRLDTQHLPEGVCVVVTESEGHRQSTRLVITR